MVGMAGLAHTEPHGTPLAVGDNQVQVLKASVSEQDNNAYLLTDPQSGRQLLIDAADDADALLALVRHHGNRGLEAVVTTHQHWDHHRALEQVVSATGARVLAGAADAAHLPAAVDRSLEHGDTIDLGTLTITVIGLRGHTPGSVALALDGEARVLLFTGDSLFPGGVGRTWSPEDFASLIDDVEERLFDVYPDSAVVHPGHGDSTTLGDERAQLPTWRARGW